MNNLLKTINPVLVIIFTFLLFSGTAWAQTSQVIDSTVTDTVLPDSALNPAENILLVEENESLAPQEIETSQLDPKTVVTSLNNLMDDMDSRYKRFKEIENSRSILAMIQRTFLRQSLRSLGREAGLYYKTAIDRDYLSQEEKTEIKTKMDLYLSVI